MRYFKRYSFHFFLLFILFTIGCSRVKTEPIEGSVIFDGQAVKAGSVTFLPKSGTGQLSRVHPTVANIVDGKFKLPQSMGVAMQEYKVVVVGYDGVPIEFSPDGTAVFREYDFEHVFKSSKEPLDIVVPESLKIITVKKR